MFESEQERVAFDAEVARATLAMSVKSISKAGNRTATVSEETLGFLKDVGLSEIKSCAYHGNYTATIIRTLGNARIFTSCHECVTAMKEADAVEKKTKQLAERNAKMQKLIGSTGIPKFFAKKTFDTFISKTDRQESIKLKFVEFAANIGKDGYGSFLIAYGATGAGKTHLSIASAISAVSKNNTVLYMLASDVIRSLRDSWGKDAVKKESEVLRQFAAVDLLVIDEIGVQFGTDSEQNHLFEVINNRILEVKPTILITNLLLSSKDKKVKTFRNYLGERTFDRMKEVGESICFDWESHRGTKE